MGLFFLQFEFVDQGNKKGLVLFVDLSRPIRHAGIRQLMKSRLVPLAKYIDNYLK